MINKRWITSPVVYSRPFASKAVFWAILNEFEFAVDKEQSTANSNSFKIAQKTAFEAKGRLYTTGEVIQRLFIIDLYSRLAIYNNYSMSPSWIWSDKITNERVARVGYNHFISNKGEWNNCFSKFSNRVLLPIFISTILQSVRKENLAHYFPYDVKLRLLADSRSFLANQKARNAIVGAENLLNGYRWGKR